MEKKRTFCVNILLVLLLYSVDREVEAACNTFMEHPNFATINETTDTDTATGYLMQTFQYLVPDSCTCGVLSAWKFTAKARTPAATAPIQFQVWERTSNEVYTLKGENYFTVPVLTADQTIEFTVPPKDRITVYGGYLIAWYTAEANVIAFNSAADDLPDGIRKAAMLDLVAGNTFDWDSGSVTLLDNVAYAIGATVTENSAPEFTNLPRKIIIYRTATILTLIYKVEASDIDPDDVSSLSIFGDDDSTATFTFDRDTQEITLSSEPALGDYTLAFTVTDQCGNNGTGNFTITVLNLEPEITNLPSFITIPEDTNMAETLLYTVAISDDDDANFAVTSFNINPSTTNITFRSDGFDKSQMSIYSKEGASYEYNTYQQYILELQLNDTTASTNIGYFLLYISKNDPPKITNLNNAAKASASYLTSTPEEAVYEVTATDAENDLLTFALLSCLPATCPFAIDEGGVISVTADLKARFNTSYVTGYDLAINVTDGFTTTDAKALTVLITDINDKPLISNLPLDHDTVVFENTALGTTIFTVSYNDLDTGDTHTVLAEFVPADGTDYFALDPSTGVLTTANTIIDYETMEGYTVILTITVSDGEDSDAQNLTIQAGEANEAPSFHQSRYTLEPPEEGTAGLTAGDPNFLIDDPDLALAANNEEHFYTWDCGVYTRYFIMERTSGAINFTTTFDLDTSDVTGPYDCTVTVTDKRGLTATTTLEIDIHDVNDNAPVFTQSTDYVFFAVPTLGDSRFIGQVSATDADKSTAYNTVYYSIIETPFDKSYLYINAFGNIYVNESWEKPEFDYGNIYLLVVQAGNAVDETPARQTATASVSLVLAATSTTTTTTTERPVAFARDTRNAAWVMVLAALGLLLMITICSLMVGYTIRSKRYRWCIPTCRRWLLNLTHVTEKIKRERYRDILLRDFEETSSEESSEDEPPVPQVDDKANTVLALHDETADDTTDMLPYAHPPFKEDVATAPRPLTEL